MYMDAGHAGKRSLSRLNPLRTLTFPPRLARLARQPSTRCSALRPGLVPGRQVALHPRSRHQYVSRLACLPLQLSSHHTDVANYNALSAASPDPITQGNANYDEIHYINALAPQLASAGFPATFVVDQGRSGQQNLRQQWGDWCNIKNAGFGTRPTTSTGSQYIDSIVWVKPGGECDGTSNSSSPRYDSTCSLVSFVIGYEIPVADSAIFNSPMLPNPLLRPVPGSRPTSRLSCPRPTRRSKR